ncbi:MAG: hypothetical protein MJK04_18320, partial [Psychrosphaera sp.]|nr:hypothetical protein [Psychrosphaera sp.]
GVMEAQKQASVWPRVFLARNTGEGHFTVVVKNSGVGPALINYVEVRVDGKVIKDWDDAIEIIAPNRPIVKGQSILTNYVLLPGETIVPIILQDEVANLFRLDTKRVRIKICYCSIYDNCWAIDEAAKRTAGFATPYPVEVCKIDVERQFLY